MHFLGLSSTLPQGTLATIQRMFRFWNKPDTGASFKKSKYILHQLKLLQVKDLIEVCALERHDARLQVTPKARQHREKGQKEDATSNPSEVGEGNVPGRSSVGGPEEGGTERCQGLRHQPLAGWLGTSKVCKEEVVRNEAKRH